MRPIPSLLVLVLFAVGCSGGGREAEQAAEAPAADTRSAAADPAAEARALDEGPRATAVLTLDAGRAERGAVLFDTKGCADCHTLGEADLAPDLLTALDARTLPWLRRQITDPEWMLEHDPLTQRLYEEYGLEMADMDVSDAEAEDILHHLLRESRSAAE